MKTVLPNIAICMPIAMLRSSKKRLEELSMLPNCVSVRSKSLAMVEQLVADWLIAIKTSVKEYTYTRYFMTMEKHILPVLGKNPLKTGQFSNHESFSAELMAS